MKIVNLTIVSVFFAFLMSSCFSIHQGNLSSDVIESNMAYKETVAGEAKSTIVFGFGGTDKNAMVQDAKRNMEVGRFLKPNERYINYTIDRKDTYYFGLVSVQKLTLHADIVEINQEMDDPMSEEFRKNYFNSRPLNRQINDRGLTELYFQENDNILLADGTAGNISKISNANVTVYRYNNVGYSQENYTLQQIYSTKQSKYKSLELGDKIDISDKIGVKDAKGEIVAFGLNSALVKYNGDKYTTIRI